MTRQPPTQAGTDLAERDVDLVVHDHHPIERDLQRAPRRADGAAGVVHVCLRPQHRHARGGSRRSSRSRPTFGDAPAKALFWTPQPPALGKDVGDHEPDVVTGVRVLASGVAQPDDQPVAARARAAATSAAATKRPQRALLPAGGALGAGALRGLGALLLALALADELGLGLDLLLLLGLQTRGDSVASTVSGSSSSVTPAGAVSAVSTIVSPICISPMSCTIDSGIAVGSASTFSSRVICSSTPPSLTPGASSVPSAPVEPPRGSPRPGARAADRCARSRRARGHAEPP